MADHSAAIAELEAILNQGAKSVTVDGVTTTYDFGEIRRRLAELRADDDATTASQRRPPIVGIKFS